MYEWLKTEKQLIRTPKFIVILPNEMRSELVGIPSDYEEFRKIFGGLKCFRVGIDRYMMIIFSAPSIVNHAGRQWLKIGYAEGTGIAYLPYQCDEAAASHVWETRSGRRPDDSGLTFSTWLENRYRALRSRYSEVEWREIRNGPSAFEEKEKSLVEARTQFHWKHLGVSNAGELLFEVHNGSGMTLPGLTVGLRSPSLCGAVGLPVSGVQPGQCAVISVACYKGIVEPTSLEPYDLPSPGPEDRKLYWEFR